MNANANTQFFFYVLTSKVYTCESIDEMCTNHTYAKSNNSEPISILKDWNMLAWCKNFCTFSQLQWNKRATLCERFTSLFDFFLFLIHDIQSQKFLVWTKKRLSCRKSAKRCQFSFVEPLRNRLYDNKDWFYQLPCFIKFVLQIRVCPSYITSFLYQWSEFSFIIVLHVFTLWLTQSNSPKLHFMTDSLYTMSRKQNKDKMGLQFVKTKNKNYATVLTSTSEHYLQMYTVRTFCFLL